MVLEELLDGMRALVTSNNTIDNYLSRANRLSTVYMQLSSSYFDTLFIKGTSRSLSLQNFERFLTI